jgi:hypothetical protein
MRKVARFLLLASRFLAICAVLAGLAAGLLEATLVADLTCFDTCPFPGDYFSRLIPGTVRVITPCVALAALALATFVGYCVATRQARRAVTAILFLLIGGLVGVGALGALMLHGQATLTVTEYGLVAETPAFEWMRQWGLALMLISGAWSGFLAYLQWDR